MKIHFSLDKKQAFIVGGFEDIFSGESQVYEEKNDCFINIKVRSILKKHILLMRKNLIQKNDKRHISDKMMSIIRQK